MKSWIKFFTIICFVIASQLVGPLAAQDNSIEEAFVLRVSDFLDYASHKIKNSVGYDELISPRIAFISLKEDIKNLIVAEFQNPSVSFDSSLEKIDKDGIKLGIKSLRGQIDQYSRNLSTSSDGCTFRDFLTFIQRSTACVNNVDYNNRAYIIVSIASDGLVGTFGVLLS